MSFILKALKKLEEEKAAQRVGSNDINSALLTPERASAKTSRVAPMLAIVLLLVIAGSSLAYMLLHQKPEPLSPAKSGALNEASRPGQAGPPLLFHAGAPLPAADSERTAASGKTGVGRNASGTDSVGAAPGTAATPSGGDSGTVLLPGRERTVQETSSSAPAGIKVNGIALHDDPDASVAVVNGILVRRGMTVMDLRVEEISHDRVRFSGHGQNYEVHISR